MNDGVVYLNGDFLPMQEASVPVMDRGFLFGDGVYEVVPVFGNKMLRVDEHLTRLDNSLDRVSISKLYSHKQWLDLFEQLLDKNPGKQRALYLQVTRGMYEKRDLLVQDGPAPTVFMMVLHIDPVSIETLEAGLSAITVEDFRWHACDIKSISLIANVMMKNQATEADAIDAIMVRDGRVTEGTASNLFIVKKGVIITPPKSNHLLSGITRDLVIDIARQNNLPYEERDIDEAELVEADEIWLTSSTREVAPVVELNKQQVADGAAGPVWRKVIGLYQDYKKQLQAT